MIDRCLRLLPRRPATRLGARFVAWLLIALCRYADADAMLERALTGHPDDPMLLTLHALGAQRTRRHAEALVRWRRRVEVGSSVARPWWGVACNLRALGLHEEATEVTREALRRFPEDPRIIEEAAFAADHRYDYEEAARLWQRLLTRRKTTPFWWQQYTGNLILLGRLEAAETMIAQARRRYPDHIGLYVNTGLLAAAREDWKTAIEVLGAYHARNPDDPGARDLLGRVLQLRNQAAIDTYANIAPVPLDVGRTEDEATRALLLGFESLGRDCEFGLVQRRYGAEPLGLLRWNATTTAGLLLGLACRFEGLGDPAYLQLSVVPEGREYCVCDPRFDFEMHTFIFEGQIASDLLFRKMCKTVGYLKEKFLADRASGSKILVYSDSDCDPEFVATLHLALRHFGVARLLWAMPVDCVPALRYPDRRPGEVREVDPGLFVGFLSRPGGLDGVWDIAFEDWVAICAAIAAIRGEPTSSEPLAAAEVEAERSSAG